MNSQLLTEIEHKQYLELFLEEATALREQGLKELVRILSPYARNCLNIAQAAGYKTLYSQIKPLYDSAGL